MTKSLESLRNTKASSESVSDTKGGAWQKNSQIKLYIKVKCSRYRPDVAHRVGRGIALLFHDRGTRRRWVVSSAPRPHSTPG